MPNPPATAEATTPRRFRPRLLPTLAAVAAVATFVTAGEWQGGRLRDKEGQRAQFDAAAALSPVPLSTFSSDADWNVLRYRAVVASGEYDARRQVLVDNRVHGGRAGYHVITPLAMADGRTVLVNRGWVPLGPSRTELPSVTPPAGPVTVVGRVATPSAGYLELAPESLPGAVWQNLDPLRFREATGIAVVPIVVEATRTPVPNDGLVRDWPAPDFGVEKHRIYMLQWYALAALAVALWLVLNVRRPRSRS